MPVDNDSVETKLAAARTRLILDKPFLGALVLRLPLTAAGDWCRTTASDARKLYYSAQYIDSLPLDQVQFVLAHEALHCALSHFARRGHRIKHRWDLACDFAINPLLIADGLTPPPDSLYERLFEGMTAEEIYPSLDDKEDEETLDQHLWDDPPPPGEQAPPPPPKEDGEHEEPPPSDDEPDGEGSGQGQADPNQGGAAPPPPLTPDEAETLQVQWQQRMAGAAQQALAAGKLGGALARMIDHLLQPQLPWRMLLARYMAQIARDDYSYMRPSRREGSAILPSLRSSEIEIVVAIDTSGSIKAEEIDEFLSEINAIKGQLRAKIHILACDAALSEYGPWQFEPWEDIELPTRLGGGGGTCFTPVFEWAEQQDRRPDALVYFTDAEGKFPNREPDFPVIWLVKGKSLVPWGTRVQLNA